jgi:hypothetical protein
MNDPTKYGWNFMKNSNQVLVAVGFSFLIGIALLGLSRSTIPSAFNPFLNAQAFLAMGFLFFGFSLGLLAATSYIIRTEKKIP